MKKIKGIFGIGASKSSSKQSSFNVHGYDIKEKDLPKLHKAAWTGDLAKVKQLAKKDPSALDKENRTPMHLACVQGHTDIVNELLAWNARTDAGDSQARTPLMKAVECYQEGCVEVLLERKKDLNLKDADHNTALHLAVPEAPAKVVAMLINGGADVNIKNKEGLTPLMLSVRDPTKRDDMTRLLLEGGANPNAVDNNKKTALHLACMEDNINHVKLLLQHRADTTLKDSKGWTAEDCAMMKAHHGCCQIIFDHNLKTRPRNSLGGSVPNTPRGAMGSISSNISATHTPRGVDSVTEPSSDLFGHPQGHQDADEDSDDPTVSQSKGEGRQDSWADDTDVSSAMDDHKLKGKVKVSLAGRVNLSDDDDVEREVEYENTRKPVADSSRRKSSPFRKVLVSAGGITRPMLSRTPTPDADLRDSPQVMNGPKTSSPSKIPVKKQPSGASNTSVDEDVLDDSDEDGEDIRRRVSFSNKQDVRNITDEDDTDIEDEEEEEEEAVPSKRPKMANPQDEADGYVPTATTSAAAAAGKLSQDKFQDDDYVNTERAMMRDLGLQGADDDLQDISDDYDDEDDEEEVDDEGDLSEGHSDRQQPSTPRGILKKSENGRPPSNQRPVESDTRRMLVQAEIHPVAGPYPQEEEESAWDTSGPSEGNQSTGNQAGNMRHMDSPEVDSDLENTLNPERSQAEKIVLSGNEDSNTATVEILAESTTPENASSFQDKLANTGEVNLLVINEFSDSTDFSQQGSRSSSVLMETMKSMKAIEENAEKDLTLSDELTSRIKEASRKSADSFNDSEDETMEKINVKDDGVTGEDAIIIFKPEETEEENCFDEIEELIEDEIHSIEDVKNASVILKETSIKNEFERSFSEGKGRRSAEVVKVIDRKSAPRVMLEYEPSTTEAESGLSDSDTLDTESLQEDFGSHGSARKSKHLVKPKQGQSKKVNQQGTLAVDTEVAKMFNESPSTGSLRVASSQDDFNRASTEPSTQDTLNNEASIKDESDVETVEGDESSQWDSTDDGYTPRDGSSKVHKKQDEIEDEDDFNDDEDYEDHKQKAADDHIHEVMTSFSTASPLPSDSPPRPGSHDTSTGSTSAQRTVVAKETVVVKETKQTEPADDDEDWDSEDEDISDEDYGGHLVVGVPGYPGAYSPVVGEVADTPPLGMDPPRPGMDSPAVEPTTPRTARDHTTSTVSDEESMSEWEKEHRQAKEAEKLRELEEEEERQRQWDEEEERRQRQLEREAQEELERERSQEFSDSDFSDDGDHLPDSAHQPLSDHSHPSQNAAQHSADSPQVSLTSPRARELKKPPPKLQVTRFIKPAPLSPRAGRTPVQLGEIENESPAQFGDHESPSPRNVRQLAAPGKMNQHVPKGMYYDDDSDVEVEEIEEEVSNDLDMSSPRKEFPGDFPVEEFQEDSPTMNFLNKAPERDSSERKFHVESPQRQSLVGRFQNGGQDGEFSSDDDIENAVMPETREEQVKGTVVVAQSTSRVMAATSLPVLRTESVLPSESFKADGNESPLLGIPPPLPVSAPPGNQKAMSLRSDGQSADDDEVELDQPVRGTKGYVSSLSQFPDLSGTTGLYRSGLDVPFDDDGLSVTSTENGDISSSYRPENLPYGKDMLVNMNLNDSSAVLKLQEHLREHRKQLEYERSQKNILEEKQRQMTKDRAGLQKSLDSLKYQKSVLEQNKLDLEAKIRQLEYQVSDEEEKKKNAELLLKKTKEQLSKKEGQYTQEMEARQRAELSMRNVQMELRAAQNQMKDLEDEKLELERKLTNEISARQLQERINEEQQRLQQQIHEESQLNSSQRESEAGEEARTALELADDDIKHTRDLVEKYKNEIIALKAELQKQRQRLTEDNSTLSAENDKLQGRCEDLRSELKDHEEALTQYTLQQNLHQQKLSSDINMLRDSLDKEHLAREKNEAELDSLRSRLQTTSSQLEKSQQTRNEIEKRLHSDRDEWARQLERKEAELSSMKDKVQAHIHALNSLETKLNSVENELQISNTSLLERTNQYHQAQREMQHYKTVHDNHDVNMRHEKEMNNKLQAKVESLQDRLSGLQHENLTLKQQVDTAQHLASDRAGYDLQEKLNAMIASLKADHDKARANLEEKNNSLQDTITRLREEIRNSENRRSNLEQDIRRLNQEQNELVRKLSMAEASLDVTNKSREHLEQERAALKIEIEKLQARYNTAQEKTIEAQTRMGELVDRLDRTEQSRLISSQQLADTSATMHAFNSSKAELEENYQKLQVDNVRLDAELKHEKQKTDMLQRDLADSQKVRSSLEALCSNLKSTNAHLEEKLGGEVANRSALVREAEDHKGLWEQEVLSRSKLGLRIAQLERHKQETATHLEEEKRRTRKALQEKKLAETKLESEQEKCQNLQKEVANLKAYLKVAKKRLRDPDSDAMDSKDTKISSLHSAFDKERHAMEEMLVSVKAQLEHMKIQLQDEVEEKERMSQKNNQLETELKTLKKLERSVDKIDRSKRKLEEEFRLYKNSVEAGYTEKSSVEEAKKEIEARFRLELNRKLDEVNNYLEEQARTRQKLDRSREEQDSKLRNKNKKMEEEVTDLRVKYEQAVARLETKDLEARRYRDLYESEMQWRMKLSEQVYHSTDKAFAFKNKFVAERQKSRLYGSMNNVNGHMLDMSRDDVLSNRLRAELDRSIAKHLEAAPHDQLHPLLSREDPVLGSSNFAKASADYIQVLKQKYCV